MAFKVSQSATYKWPVKVRFPKDGGQFDEQAFDVEFRRIPQARISEILNPETKMTDKVLAKELVAGWQGIQGEDGNDLAFTDATLDMVIDIPLVAAAISEAWLDSINNARRKN